MSCKGDSSKSELESENKNKQEEKRKEIKSYKETKVIESTNKTAEESIKVAAEDIVENIVGKSLIFCEDKQPYWERCTKEEGVTACQHGKKVEKCKNKSEYNFACINGKIGENYRSFFVLYNPEENPITKISC